MQTTNTTTEILVSLGTVPVLAILLGGRVLAALMQDLGEVSEELFRGDRLPILHIPMSDSKASDPENPAS